MEDVRAVGKRKEGFLVACTTRTRASIRANGVIGEGRKEREGGKKRKRRTCKAHVWTIRFECSPLPTGPAAGTRERKAKKKKKEKRKRRRVVTL